MSSTTTDRQSLPLLSSLTAGGNRPSTTYVAPSTRVLGDNGIPRDFERGILEVMRTFAYNWGQAPPRYQVNRGSLSAEAGLIASGTYAGVRKGRVCDEMVAVRTLRID